MTDNKENVNWSRFGLDPVGRTEPSPPRSHHEQSSEFKAIRSTATGNPNVKDLFDEEQVKWRELRGNFERLSISVFVFAGRCSKIKRCHYLKILQVYSCQQSDL